MKHDLAAIEFPQPREGSGKSADKEEARARRGGQGRVEKPVTPERSGIETEDVCDWRGKRRRTREKKLIAAPRVAKRAAKKKGAVDA